MSEAVAIRKVKIDPIGCYKQAFELVQGRPVSNDLDQGMIWERVTGPPEGQTVFLGGSRAVAAIATQDAAFEEIAHAEVLRHLPGIHRLPLVGER